jgi:hypothetical protein
MPEGNKDTHQCFEVTKLERRKLGCSEWETVKVQVVGGEPVVSPEDMA